MYIILDTNIWISELGLNSARGAAFRFFVKNRDATVVLPEVIKLETERHLKIELCKYVNGLEKNYRQLLSIFGKLKELVLPKEEDIDAKVATIFGECKIKLLEVPLSLGSARSSFLRTIDKSPPSDKDQQFKDGIIWAECIRLVENDDVYIVTADKAFYKGRQYGSGLAEGLILDTKDYKHSICIFPTLSDLLETIKTEVKIDEKALVNQFWESSSGSIDGILDRNSFVVSGNPTVGVQLYVTEDPNRLYAEFSITYQCEDLTSDGRSDAVLILNGDCTYLVQESLFEAFRNHGEELQFKTKDGEEKSLHNYVLFANSIVIGHKTIEHTIRHKLDN
jgi:hypothetical protein